MLMMCYTSFSRPIKMGTCRRRRRTGKPHQDGRHVTATESSGRRGRESESKSKSESESESESKSESASQSGVVCIEMDVMAPPLSHWARKYATTHCNILQCTATHYNTLQHTAIHCKCLVKMDVTAPPSSPRVCSTLHYTATHCNTLQRTATYCNALQRPHQD